MRTAAPIWYDGEALPRSEALARIERDALDFVAGQVIGFEGDDSVWLLLLDGLELSGPRDEPDHGTFARSFSVEVTADEVVFHLSHRLPRELEATYAALCTQTWCVAPRLRLGSIALSVRGLGPVEQTRLATALTARAEARRAGLGSGVAAFVQLVAPDELPRLAAALESALKRFDAIASSKRERLAAACVSTRR